MSGHSTGEQPDPGPRASESNAGSGSVSGSGTGSGSGSGADQVSETEAGLVAEAAAAAQQRQLAEAANTAETSEHGKRAVPGTSPGVAGGAATVAESQRAVAAQAGVKQVADQRGGPRVHQFEPDEHSPLTALSNAISANFRRALMASALALVGLGLTYSSGGVLGDGANARVEFFTKHAGLGQITAIVGAVLFLVFGVIAVRTATNEILKTVPHGLGDNRRNGLRWVCLLVGYLVVIFGTLGALNVPIERLFIGGAVTGVILGIAAQQSLGNLFAGLMLLLTRPFAIGDEVSLRSGPLGGVLTGMIADMNLTYVKLVTDNGTILLPNSTLLTAAVGPPGVFDVSTKP